MLMALQCPKCSTALSLWTRKKNPFPCPSCGTNINVKIRTGPSVIGFIVWCIASIPLYRIDSFVHFPGAIIRIAIEVIIAIPIMIVLFDRFSSVTD